MQKSRFLKYLKPGMLFVVASILAIIYFGGAWIVAQENYKMQGKDQFAYMNYARQMHNSGYTFVGGRNRMPVYPFILSLVYQNGMDDETFFDVSKKVNIVLSGIILLTILAIFYTAFASGLYALLMTSVVASSLFIYKAGYVQAELLFYLFLFIDFLLLAHLLRRPNWKVGAIAGVMLGITHLIKASVLPLLALFLAAVIIRELYLYFGQKRKRQLEDELPQSLLKRMIPVIFVVILFLVTIYPYIATSKRVFGHYFYNVNSTFYIWYDSWEEVKAGTRAHGDRSGWPTMPENELPSFSKYVREHSTSQIFGRFIYGARSLFEYAKTSFGYLKYVVLSIFVLLVGTIVHWKKIWSTPGNVAETIFSFGFLAGYFALYSWYYPLADGPDSDRFILALYIPLLFLASKMIFTNDTATIRGKSLVQVFGTILLVFFLIDVRAFTLSDAREYQNAYYFVRSEEKSGDAIASTEPLFCFSGKFDCQLFISNTEFKGSNRLATAINTLPLPIKWVENWQIFAQETRPIWLITSIRKLPQKLSGTFMQELFLNTSEVSQFKDILVLRIQPDPLDLPEQPTINLSAHWADTETELRGADVAFVGENEIQLTLFWDNPILVNDFKVFVQLRDSNNNTVLQADHVIFENIPYEIRILVDQQDELVRDAVVIHLPAGINLSNGRLIVGIYNIKTGDRLPLVNDEGGEQGVWINAQP